MASKKPPAEAFDLPESLLTAFATNNRINTYLIRNVPDEAWRLKGPGGKGRDIASIIAHMHNVRLMWLKAMGATAAMPEKLDGASVTKDEGIAALEASWRALEDALRAALRSNGHTKVFKPGLQTRCGQLARQVGHGLSQSAMFGIWERGTR